MSNIFFSFFQVLFLVTTICFASFSQEAKYAYFLETSLQYGTIIKHTSRFTPEIIGPTSALEISTTLQTTGKKSWQHLQKYPEFNLAFIHHRFSNADTLGQSFSIFPSVNIPLLKKTKYKISLRVGAGIGYLNKYYNAMSNPNNDVIGSAINNITSFSLNGDYQVTPRFHIKPLITITHHSNSAFKLPNLGINSPYAGIGIKYAINNPNNKYLPFPDSLISPSYNKRIHLYLMSSLGIKEYLKPGGPKYYVYFLHTYLSKLISPTNRLSVGINWEYNENVYDMIIINSVFPDKQFVKSVRIGLFMGDEILFGSIGLYGQLGTYLYNPFLKGGVIFSRLGVQFHWSDYFKKLNKDIYTGIYVRAHQARADFLEIGLGIGF